MSIMISQPRHRGAKSEKPREVWRGYQPRHRMAWMAWPLRAMRAESDAYWDSARRRKDEEAGR